MELDELKEIEIKRMNEAYYRLVDLIITLSTGAVALSVTFRTSLSGQHGNTAWLKISWIAFILAIVAGLFAHYGKIVHHKRMANIFDLKEELTSSTVYLQWWANLAKWTMPLGFVGGLVTFAIFAWSSLD